MIDLAELGWDERWVIEFQKPETEGLVPGRVSLEHNHVYRVLTAEGERLAETAGRLKHRAAGRHELPAVGDWVGVRSDSAGNSVLIRHVLPRRTAFSRKAAGRETVEQVVAANIDIVLVVAALDGHVKPRSLERYLILVRNSGAKPVLVLNKADLSDDAKAAREVAMEVAGSTPVLLVSARTGEGFDPIRALMQRGRTLAAIGPSGAGKSSIVNRLVGGDVASTGDVRERDSRGRHTSVHRHLVPLGQAGVIIDTPGMRELQLWDADDAVDETFADVTALADACRFRDCQHDREPGCAVKAAVENDQLSADRYAHYLQLRQERADTVKLQETRAQMRGAGRRKGR